MVKKTKASPVRRILINAQNRRLPRGVLILYEDRDLLVIDKPAGLLSIATGTEQEKTAYRIIAEYMRKKGEKRRPAAVHRLDRDTSGLMIFVKSAAVKKNFMDHWDELVRLRRYTALAEGDIRTSSGGKSEGIMDAPLGEDRGGRVVVRSGGKSAVTRWTLLTIRGNDRDGLYSLLSLELETGRRNQIRAHLSHLGHPVAGDKKYAARTNPLGRLALHAGTLAFFHPHDGRLMKFESPLPSLPLSPRRESG
ncbi:MAG: RluA family pseudouridine synthase [Spirochaetaceae bacterium]|jgi:23S rRNA pseudouridine1911/1915/1917 synthase|nr:RluA family pseudouridine synthase [Spirochaetaceae bacterium]